MRGPYSCIHIPAPTSLQIHFHPAHAYILYTECAHQIDNEQ